MNTQVLVKHRPTENAVTCAHQASGIIQLVKGVTVTDMLNYVTLDLENV